MDSNLPLFFAVLIAATVFGGAAMSGTIRYRGLCEASAAAVLDENHFAVASDDSEKLSIYLSGTEEPISREFRQPDVTDIEGAARIGDKIFWVTSHSLNKNGKDKPERQLLFATTISRGPSLIAKGVPYRNLRADIAEALGIAEKDLKASLNIEGVTSTTSGSLLLGLRGPLDSEEPGRAYIVEISNLSDIVEGGEGAAKRAEIVKVHRLKLFDDSEQNGRGIRSIERAGDRYVIVAGSVQDSDEPAKFYSWDGKSDEGLTPISGGDLGGLVPEALIAWSASDLQVLGDNGGVFVDGKECDDKDEKPPGVWFPSDRFSSDPP